MGSPNLFSGPLRPRDKRANSGAWQAQALILCSIWSLLSLGASVCMQSVCFHVPVHVWCVSICPPLIKLQRTPWKDMDSSEKVQRMGD